MKLIAFSPANSLTANLPTYNLLTDASASRGKRLEPSTSLQFINLHTSTCSF
ncbi:MAG: hypothetical protein AB1589_14865 [Cyanobacteriota bacterium]